MYRIVIADDDEIQLQGMCCAFPWNELGIEVAAGVDDGDKALSAVLEENADIVLTDIKMTNMDGLYLTEQIKVLRPQMKVVIMSAYDDFEFAQKALRLGVEDYLLKPIDLNRMRETMCQIVHQKKEEEKRAELENRSKQIEQVVPKGDELLEEMFFQNVLSQRYTKEMCRQLGKQYINDLQYAWQVIEIIFDCDDVKKDKQNIIKNICNENGYKYIYSLGFHLICCFGNENTLKEKVGVFKQECRVYLKKYDMLDDSFFIQGTIVPELYYLRLSYEKIIQIRSYKMAWVKNQDLSEKDLDTYFNERHTLNKSLAEYLAKLVIMGNTDMLSGYVEKLKGNLRLAGNDSILMLSFSTSLILGELRMPAKKAGVCDDVLDEIYYSIMRQGTLV